MAISVHRKNLNIKYWQVSGPNIVRPNLCNTSTTFFTVDPSTVDTLSGTKASTFTQSQLDANFKFVTSSAITVTSADFTDANWTSLGWTPGTDATFFTELSTFIKNNFGQQAVNPNLSDVVLVVARGTLGGVDYSVPFLFFGNIGDISTVITDTNRILLMHFDVVDPTVNNSSFTHSISNHGTVTTQSGISKFGNAASINVATSGQYVSVAHQNDLEVRNSDFTIDFWFYVTDDTHFHGMCAFQSDFSHLGVAMMPASFTGTGNARMGYFASATGSATWDIAVGDGPHTGLGSIVPAPNTWNHVAYVRKGNIFYGFLNGALDWTLTSSATITGPVEPFNIGRWGNNNANFDLKGYIDEFRFSNGFAQYTEAFTPPNVPYENGSASTADSQTSLLLHLNGITNDSSTYNQTVSVVGSFPTYVTGKFGQAAHLVSGYLEIPNDVGNQLNLGSGDFTIDFWWKPDVIGGPFNSNGNGNHPIARQATGTGFAFDWRYTALSPNTGAGNIIASPGATWTSPNYSIYVEFVGLDGNGVGTFGAFGFDTVGINTTDFHHIALVRSGNVVTGYFNGVASGTMTGVSGSPGYSPGRELKVGSSSLASQNNFGTFDEVRLSKGIARWTSNFVPPTSPYES